MSQKAHQDGFSAFASYGVVMADFSVQISHKMSTLTDTLQLRESTVCSPMALLHAGMEVRKHDRISFSDWALNLKVRV